MKSLLAAIPLALPLVLGVANAQSCTVNGRPCDPPLPPCAAAPIADTLNGSVGATACAIPMDSTRPTAVQAQNTTLDANCNWSLTFGRTSTSGMPIVHANVLLAGATSPVPCITTVRSTTGASGKCFPAQTTTLNLSIITAGLNLAPFATTCTAGTPVMIVVREPTF